MPTRWFNRPLVGVAKARHRIAVSSLQASSVNAVGATGSGAEGRRGTALRGVGGIMSVVVGRRGSSSFVVTGVTVNSSGSPLGNVNVYLFRAGSMELVSVGVSDAEGAYSLPASAMGGSFLVVSVHPDGSLAGSTLPILALVNV